MTASSSTLNLSLSKREFVNNHKGKFFTTHQLSVKEIKHLRDYYAKKYNIKIVINGETDYGKRLIQKEHDEFHYKKITSFQLKSINYPIAIYLQMFFQSFKEINHDEGSLFHDNTYYDVIEEQGAVEKAIPANYKSADGRGIKKKLTEKELQELNAILIKNLPSKLVAKIISQSKKYINEQKSKKGNTCLSHKSAICEINDIRKKITNDEALGYVYTNGIVNGKIHFEFVIITKKNIIKPIVWNSARLYGRALYDTSFASPACLTPRIEICPQADTTSCGPLGMSYLKELLKDNACQLNQSTLTFKFVDDGKIKQFFLPSPQVLTYSQSSHFNHIIKCLIESDDDYIEIEHKGMKYSLLTVRGALKKGISSDELSNDEIQHNINLLKNLSTFREKWLKQYDSVGEKRDMLFFDRKNNYLAYKSNKAKDISTQEIAYKENEEGISHEDDSIQNCMDDFKHMHKTLFEKDRSKIFGFFRRTKISSEWLEPTKESLKHIITHAKMNNNRSRKVCINLGWMNANGTVSKSAPPPIHEIYASSHIGTNKLSYYR